MQQPTSSVIGLELHLVHQWQELAFDVPSRVRSGGCDDLCVSRCSEASGYFTIHVYDMSYIYILTYIYIMNYNIIYTYVCVCVCVRACLC